MRTMIIIDDALHRKAKAYAAQHGKTLAAVIEETLRWRLSLTESSRSKKRVRIPTFRGDGLHQGVNLDDMSTVYDRIDGVR